jgi:hypothetical protein
MASIQDLVGQLNDGSSNPQTANSLHNSLNTNPGNTDEPTRDLIRDAVINQNIPVGSNSSGYFLIDSEQELDDVVTSLESRIQGLQDRINSLRSGWQKRKKDRKNGGNWPK